MFSLPTTRLRLSIVFASLLGLWLPFQSTGANPPPDSTRSAGRVIKVKTAEVNHHLDSTKVNWLILMSNNCGFCHRFLPYYCQFAREHRDSLNLIVITSDKKPQKCLELIRSGGYKANLLWLDPEQYGGNSSKRLRQFETELCKDCYREGELLMFPTHWSFGPDGSFSGKLAYDKEWNVARELRPDYLQEFIRTIPDRWNKKE